MKFDYPKIKGKEETISKILLGLSVVLAIVIMLKIADVFITSAEAQKVVKTAFARSKLDPNDLQKYFDGPKESAEKLKKENLFVPPTPKKHPVKQVSGILGNEVLINGKWYKAGDKVGDAKILAIEPTRVKIEWDGKEKFFAPIEAAASAKPENKAKKERPQAKKPKAAAAKSGGEKVAEANTEDPLAWIGVKLSPALRAKLLEKWNTMSEEEKQQWKQQWSSLTDEQKRKIVEQMEQNIDQI